MANTEVGIKLTLSGDQQVRTALSGVEERMDRLTGAVSRAGHYGAAFIGLTQGLIPVAQAAVRAADSVTTLNNQLKLATGSTQAASKAYEALFDIAQRSRVSFTELGGTFASISRAGQELGLNQQRLLGVTEAIGNAMTISGGSAESMNAALVQLGQGLASGTLRGEELNSVMEQTPRLAKAIADGLGVPIGKLREMGAAGEISAEQVIRALESQSAVLRGEVTSSVLTVGQAMTQMQNAAVLAVGEMDKATGASSLAASALSTLATTLGEVGQAFKDNELAIKTGMGALGGAAVGAGLLVAAGNIGKITVAVRALGVALSANPYVLAAMGIAAAGGAFVAYSGAKSNTLDVMKSRLKDLQSLESKGDRGMYGNKVSEEALAKRRAEIKRLQLAIAELDSVNLDTRAEDARMAAMVKNTKAAEADREAYANLSRSLSGFKGNYKEYTDNVALINRLRDRGAISEKEAAQRLAELAQKHGLAAKAVKGNQSAERELAEQRRSDLKVAELRNQQIDERLKFEAELAKQQAAVVAQEYESADATNAQALARELANDKTVDATLAMQQLTLAQLEQQRLDLEATDNVIPGYIQALEARIAAQKRLVAATQTGITQEVADKSAKEAEEAWRKASDKIEDALTDALMRGFDDGKGFAENLRDTVVNMFKTMVLRPVIQAIVQPVGQSIAGSLLGSGSAGGLVGGLSSINSISTLYSAISGGMASSIGGALASAGGFLGSSTLSSFAAGMQGSTLAAGLAGPTTAGATGAMGLGASFASALPYVAAAAALVELTGLGSRWRGDPDAFLVQARNAGANPYQSSIGTAFGTVGFANGTSRIRKNGQMISEYGETEDFSVTNQKQTLEVIRQLDAAIASTLTEGEIAKVSQNLDGWYKKSWSFSGGMLGDWVADRYRAVFDSMGSSLGKMFAQFKFDEKTLPQYFELFAVLKSGGKEMESFALALAHTISAGDNTAESALALTQSLVGVNAVLDQLGLGAIQMTVDGANAAAAMLQQFGGFDAFVSRSSAYYQAYYSEAERTADATRQIAEAMAKLGLGLPATRDEFRDLVEAQNLTTESGRQTYTALIGLSEAFAALTPNAVDLTVQIQATQEALGDLFSELAESLAEGRGAVAETWAAINGPVAARTFAQLTTAVNSTQLPSLPSTAGIDKAAASLNVALAGSATADAAMAAANKRIDGFAELDRMELAYEALYNQAKDAYNATPNKTSTSSFNLATPESVANSNYAGGFWMPAIREFSDVVWNAFNYSNVTLRNLRDSLGSRTDAAAAQTLASSNQAKANTAVSAANSELIKQQDAYIDAVSLWIDSSKQSMGALSDLREETLAYYETQQALADLMQASATGLRGAVQEALRSTLTDALSIKQRLSDYDKAYALGLSTSGAIQAGYADQMAAALPQLAQDMAGQFSSRAEWSLAVNRLAAQASQVAGKLEVGAPKNYQAEANLLLGLIDGKLATLEASSKSAEAVISEAINNGAGRTAAGLQQIINQLQGKTVTAFAAGGTFSNGIVTTATVAPQALFGEAGPEAIMPLARGPGGVLGVRMLAGAGDAETAASADMARLLRDLVDENRRLNGQMNDLKQEVSQMRKENNLGNSQLATDSKLMRRLQEKWDVTGLPVTTQAA